MTNKYYIFSAWYEQRRYAKVFPNFNFQKCLAVQNERQPRNSATVQNPIDSELYSQANFLHDRTNVLSTTIDLKSNSTKSINKKSNEEESGSSLNPEMTARMFFVAIKWTKTLPTFSMLSLSDQVRLSNNVL